MDDTEQPEWFNKLVRDGANSVRSSAWVGELEAAREERKERWGQLTAEEKAGGLGSLVLREKKALDTVIAMMRRRSPTHVI